ncbi:MAG: AAA family ATPase, partial [Tannerella sp.]|nr:AAA family ATPase [Tannerella sp.]
MTTNNRKLPIGIQDFEDLRQNGYLYVDKTAYIYRLVTMGKPYFLGRPRRFGKSLFLSTLKAYFLGKKELFEGLEIADMEKDWIEYPVLYIDLNGENYTDLASLESGLGQNLRPMEEDWGRDPEEKTSATRFAGVIKR